MNCFVDGTKAACTEFVKQGVLACRVAAGNRVGLSGKRKAILAGDWGRLRSGLRKVSTTWLPETVAGRRHGGLSQTCVDTASPTTRARGDYVFPIPRRYLNTLSKSIA